MGDPAGIGPEVIARALDDGAVRKLARWVIFGSDRAMERAARACKVSAPWIDLHEHFASSTLSALHTAEVGLVDLATPAGLSPSHDFLARAEASNGQLSFFCVERAIALARLPHAHPWHASAVVTGPINKEAWALAGHTAYPGHTELFAERFGAAKSAMMFHAPVPSGGEADSRSFAAGLNVVLVTTHRPLRTVAEAISTQRILDVIRLGDAAMRRLGYESPRIGVCGLNPHAGEHGLLGDEDERVIAPAVAAAKGAGLDVSGPFPADTIFQSAVARPGKPAAKFDLVVAMYHDQGLIPLKTLAWDRAVNMTIGLEHEGKPIFRTSPDHGTAFDIAGRAIADAGSMKAAMVLAARMAAAIR